MNTYISPERMRRKAMEMFAEAAAAEKADAERAAIRPMTEREKARHANREENRRIARKQWFEVTLPHIIAMGALAKARNGAIDSKAVMVGQEVSA